MPINRRLIAGVDPTKTGGNGSGNPKQVIERSLPPGAILGKKGEESAVAEVAEEGRAAFVAGIPFGRNPYGALRQTAFHNAWSTGWKGARQLSLLELKAQPM